MAFLIIIESFIICKDFCPPAGYHAHFLNAFLDGEKEVQKINSWEDQTEEEKYCQSVLMPFITMGDLSAFDLNC